MCCSELQGVAVCCSVLYRVTSLDSPSLFWSFFALTEACCNGLQCVAVCCSVLEILSVDGQPSVWIFSALTIKWTYAHHVLQCVAVCCSVLQRLAVCFSVLQCVAVCRIALYCVSGCCGVLECVVSVLFCVPVVCCRWRCRVGTSVAVLCSVL